MLWCTYSMMGVFLVSRSNVFLPGNTLEKVGECEKRLGEAEKEFLQTSAISFLTPLRNFLEGDWRTISVSLEYHIYSNAVWVIHPIYTIYHTLYHDKVILWYSVCCKTIMCNTSWYQYNWKKKNLYEHVKKHYVCHWCVYLCINFIIQFISSSMFTSASSLFFLLVSFCSFVPSLSKKESRRNYIYPVNH